RAVGKAIMGPIENTEYKLLSDAKWNEKFAAALLIIGIVAIGIAPFWLNHLIGPGADEIMKNIGRAVTLK
ncbi:MAG: hypothetical protein ACHQEB_06880, partial [Chitinophagales bacterium]